MTETVLIPDAPHADAVLTFALEPYSAQLISEMRPLWQEHYKELSHFPDVPLDPDITVYSRCASAGLLRIFTARIQNPEDAEETTLVGYNIFLVQNHPHYRGTKTANQDIIYFDKDIRLGMAGYKFIRWCDEQLKKDGMQMVYQHVRAKRSFAPLLERLGYSLMDMVYAKRLAA
jgi:hypothetical protein